MWLERSDVPIQFPFDFIFSISWTFIVQIRLSTPQVRGKIESMHDMAERTPHNHKLWVIIITKFLIESQRKQQTRMKKLPANRLLTSRLAPGIYIDILPDPFLCQCFATQTLHNICYCSTGISIRKSHYRPNRWRVYIYNLSTVKISWTFESNFLSSQEWNKQCSAAKCAALHVLILFGSMCIVLFDFACPPQALPCQLAKIDWIAERVSERERQINDKMPHNR